MALPPEPLRELIPLSTTIVVAVVTAILSIGTTPDPPPNAAKLPKGSTSVGRKAPEQWVRIKIERVLYGKAPETEEIEVKKPEAGYTLHVGNQGPFFLDAEGTIIGRYGPDTHREAAIVQALKASP
jgi:hypothetical protein